MAEEFDPYRKWLGIPPKDQPPHHYRLLGIATFEDDPDVIENAASRQMTHVRTFQSGKHGPVSQRILNELTAAKLCLLQPDKKQAYDAVLRQRLAAAGQLSSSGPLDAAVEEEADYPPPPPADFRTTDGRWRTTTDGSPQFPDVGVAPVPIPMPPPVGASASLSGAQKIRRTGYSGSSGRPRKSSSAMPMLLVMGSVALLALAGIVAVLMSMNNQPTPQPKPPLAHEKATPDRPATKRPLPNSPTNTPFTVGSNNRPPRPQPHRPQPSPPAAIGTESTPPMGGQNPREYLTKARHSLEHRNDSDFRFQISQAEFLVAQQKPADADALKADEQHLRDVEKLLNNFWQAVREGADKKIPKGMKVSFKRHELEIVSREGDQLTYKFDGVEHVAGIKKLPPRVAMYMALRVFGQENLDGKIAIVVFQLIDAEASRDVSCQRLAGRLLGDIQQAGVTDNPVLQREQGKATKPPENKDEELSGPLIIGSTAAPTDDGPDKPFDPKIGAAVANDSKQLDPMLVKEAREKFDKEIRPRMLQATEDLAVAKTLLADLKTELEKDGTAEYKVKLLKEGVIDLAARVGDLERIAAAADEVAKLSGEKSIDIQLQGLRQLNFEDPAVVKALLQHAQTVAGKVQASGDLFQAAELLTIAKRAAEKANLKSEAQALQLLLDAVEKLRADKK